MYIGPNNYDLLVTLTLASLPVENGDDGNTLGPNEINGETVDLLIGWYLTYSINFTGHPAASVPAGLAGGLPVGMQIVGRRYADTDVQVYSYLTYQGLLGFWLLLLAQSEDCLFSPVP